jgi:uncharacterized membrane protein
MELFHDRFNYGISYLYRLIHAFEALMRVMHAAAVIKTCINEVNITEILRLTSNNLDEIVFN